MWPLGLPVPSVSLYSSIYCLIPVANKVTAGLAATCHLSSTAPQTLQSLWRVLSAMNQLSPACLLLKFPFASRASNSFGSIILRS